MPNPGFTLDGKPIKASVRLDYKSNRTLGTFQWFERKALIGADATFKDGKGNVIKVNIREGDVGYRIELNGQTIAEG